jgi:hypothetical protein
MAEKSLVNEVTERDDAAPAPAAVVVLPGVADFLDELPQAARPTAVMTAMDKLPTRRSGVFMLPPPTQEIVRNLSLCDHTDGDVNEV